MKVVIRLYEGTLLNVGHTIGQIQYPLGRLGQIQYPLGR